MVVGSCESAGDSRGSYAAAEEEEEAAASVGGFSAMDRKRAIWESVGSDGRVWDFAGDGEECGDVCCRGSCDEGAWMAGGASTVVVEGAASGFFSQNQPIVDDIGVVT
jgi:hypothetical protein